MNKLKNIFTIILLFLIIYFIFKYNYLLKTSVIDSVTLWLTKVFPSLFIMFILNNLIIGTNILNNYTYIINKIFNKIFNTTGLSFQAFLLSLFSGTPTSAFILKEMLENKLITTKAANKLIGFTYFSNPLFLYNILSLSFNNYITIKIILIHYLSNIFIGLILRKNKELDILQKNIPSQSKNIFLLLPEAITKSINTLLMILGTITFYMIITNIIIKIFPLNNLSQITIKGIFEITQSLNSLTTINIPSIIKEIIAISIISFGGLSIHTQVIALLSDTKISYKNFLIGRIFHLFISTNTYILLYFILPS